MSLVNTQYFCDQARAFEKDKTYCRYPKGSYSHKIFWEEMDSRCRNGYKVGDLHIPGTMYFYLNFVRILKLDEDTGRKRLGFPDFTDVDLEYFLNVERARKEKKGIAILKPRRLGFTYKSSALSIHEYLFFRDAKVIIGAYQSDLSELAMNYIIDALGHIDRHTEWKKQRNPDLKDYIKARYKEIRDGVEVWRGNNSEIRSITYKDNAWAAIGKSASVFIMDEVGRWKDLIQSYNVSEPCWKDGDNVSGLVILQGTAASMDVGTEEFYEIFYNPEKYNLISFDNVYDEGQHGKKCAWFIPASRMRFGQLADLKGKLVLDKEGKPIEMVDKDGNSNMEAATESILNLRKQKAAGHDPRALHDVTVNYPLTPSDAFLRSKSNNYPIYDLAVQQAELENNEIYKNAEYVGELVIDAETNKIEWKLNTKLQPIRRFPLKREDNRTGAVIIYEMPYKDSNGSTPNNLFLAGIDTFDHTQSTTDSLGSIFIYNKLNKKIVAEYTGRPEEDNRFYEQCRRLLLFYNALGLYENNWKGLFTYFEHKHSVHLLAQKPKIMRDVVMESNTIGKEYGARITKEYKAWGDNLIRVWLSEKWEEGDSETMNLQKIRSIPLLQELIAYNQDGNFDRHDSLRMLMILIEETRSIDAGQLLDRKLIPVWEGDFFKKPLYLHKSNVH